MLRWLAMMIVLTGGMITGRTANAADPDVVDEWLDSVVLLVTGGAFCSGVVIDDEGTVATAYHCVASGLKTAVYVRADEGLSRAEQTPAMGRTFAAAPRDDLALVRVPELAGQVPARPIRRSTIRPGEAAFGLGHPFAPAADQTDAMEGMLLWSVTEGIVSAVGPKLIQTDAALNPGNSGGPLVDGDGAIIGITSRKLEADNIAFAASAETLVALVEEPTPPKLLGGDFALGLSWLGGSPLLGYDARSLSVDSSLELIGRVSLRDRAVVTAGLGLSSPGRLSVLERGVARAPALEGSLALRQRFGRGEWSTTLDVGGGYWVVGGLRSEFDADRGTWTVYAMPPISGPGVTARLGLQGLGLRVVGVLDRPESPLLLLGLDLDVPGILATF